MRRFSVATRTMKDSSKFELKMARNFTRSSRGTLGSCASSSTRRLNSSHDSSRLTNAFVFVVMSPSTVECFAQENAVTHAARADDERQIAPEDHDLLDDDGAGQDNVGALGFEPANPAPLALGETLQALANRRDVGLGEVQPVAVLALPAMRPPEVNTRQRADGAAQAHDHLVGPGGGQNTLQPLADLRAQRLERPRLGPIVAQEAAGRPHRAEREARRGDDLVT